MPRRSIALFLFLTLPGVAGCANLLDSDTAKSRLTAQHRDSVLAGSDLPGAATVGRALDEGDRAAARAAALDSIAR